MMQWHLGRWVAAAMALGATAFGQMSGEIARAPNEIGSERTSAVEVKLGAFLPMVDREFSGAAQPYKDTYGDNAMLLLELSWERQVFQAFGTAAVGLSAGYGEKFAPARLASGLPSAESTGFRVFPFRLFGAYRFDYAAYEYGVPLIPYAKLGLNYTAWSVTKGSELEVTAAGGSAIGGRFGASLSVGLSLLLDFFEPRLARDLDTDLGVNHSYLFAEYNLSEVNGFGSPGIDLSGRYFTFGAAFEF